MMNRSVFLICKYKFVFQVILCFHEQFWDHSLHMFGHVGTSWITRGEFFLFWHLSETPVCIPDAGVHDGKHTCMCLCCANLVHFMVEVSPSVISTYTCSSCYQQSLVVDPLKMIQAD